MWGRNYHGETTCIDFLHQNLGRRSEEEKLLLEDTLPFPCACMHTHTHPIFTFLIRPHTPAFKLQQNAVRHSHIFFPKSQLKAANVCRCEWVWDCTSVCASLKKNLIGKLYLGASGDCAATVNDLSEKHIPQYTGGLCPGAIIEWPLRAWLLLTFPPVNKLSFFSSEEVDPFSSLIYTAGFRHGVRSKTESNELHHRDATGQVMVPGCLKSWCLELWPKRSNWWSGTSRLFCPLHTGLLEHSQSD